MFVNGMNESRSKEGRKHGQADKRADGCRGRKIKIRATGTGGDLL